MCLLMRKYVLVFYSFMYATACILINLLHSRKFHVNMYYIYRLTRLNTFYAFFIRALEVYTEWIRRCMPRVISGKSEWLQWPQEFRSLQQPWTHYPSVWQKRVWPEPVQRDVKGIWTCAKLLGSWRDNVFLPLPLSFH